MVLPADSRVSRRLDRVIAAVDECVIENGLPWKALVVGVHRDGGAWWLQISSDRHPGVDLLLRLPLVTTVEQTIAALRQWRPSDSPAQTIMIAGPVAGRWHGNRGRRAHES